MKLQAVLMLVLMATVSMAGAMEPVAGRDLAKQDASGGKTTQDNGTQKKVTPGAVAKGGFKGVVTHDFGPTKGDAAKYKTVMCPRDGFVTSVTFVAQEWVYQVKNFRCSNSDANVPVHVGTKSTGEKTKFKSNSGFVAAGASGYKTMSSGVALYTKPKLGGKTAVVGSKTDANNTTFSCGDGKKIVGFHVLQGIQWVASFGIVCADV